MSEEVDQIKKIEGQALELLGWLEGQTDRTMRRRGVEQFLTNSFNEGWEECDRIKIKQARISALQKCREIVTDLRDLNKANAHGITEDRLRMGENYPERLEKKRSEYTCAAINLTDAESQIQELINEEGGE